MAAPLKRDGVSLALLALALAVLTRAPVWPLSQVDWDESLYLLIGRDILAGRLPYQGIFDHKPAGLYYLFAFAQAVFGETVASIRILAMIACAVTATFVGLYVRRAVGGGLMPAAVASTLYIVLSMANGGLATNTEVLLNAGVAIVFWLTSEPGLARGLYWKPSALLGLVFGFMFEINYLSGVFVLAFCLSYALALAVQRAPRPAGVYLGNGAIILCGFLLANALVLTPIAIWGDLPDYLARQARFLAGYGVNPEPWRIRLTLSSVLEAYGMLLALAGAMAWGLLWRALRHREDMPRPWLVLAQMLLYAAVAAFAAVASGRLYPHYFLLLLPMLAVVAAAFLGSLPREGLLRPVVALWLVLAAFAAPSATQNTAVEQGLRAWPKYLRGEPPDAPAEIAAAISRRLQGGNTIYVYNYQHVLYYLTRTDPPTRRPFRAHHLIAPVAAAAGVAPAAEMRRILAHRPQFIVAGTDPHDGAFGEPSRILSRALAHDYRVLHVYRDPTYIAGRPPKSPDDRVWLYERRDP